MIWDWSEWVLFKGGRESGTEELSVSRRFCGELFPFSLIAQQSKQKRLEKSCLNDDISEGEFHSPSIAFENDNSNRLVHFVQ